jgi:hypothetical protein
MKHYDSIILNFDNLKLNKHFRSQENLMIRQKLINCGKIKIIDLKTVILFDSM